MASIINFVRNVKLFAGHPKNITSHDGSRIETLLRQKIHANIVMVVLFVVLILSTIYQLVRNLIPYACRPYINNIDIQHMTVKFQTNNSVSVGVEVGLEYEFGLDSCFHEKPLLQYSRVIIGIVVQVLCSYGILPLYAIITQMGSKMKRSIFDDQTSKALKHWHKNASKRRESKGRSGHLAAKTIKLNSASGNSQAHDAPPTTDSSTQSAQTASKVDIPQDKQKP